MNLRLKLCLVSAYTLPTSNQFTGHLEIWDQAENMLCSSMLGNGPTAQKMQDKFYMKDIIPYRVIKGFP